MCLDGKRFCVTSVTGVEEMCGFSMRAWPGDVVWLQYKHGEHGQEMLCYNWH